LLSTPTRSTIRAARVIAALAAVLALAGCLDVVQYVSGSAGEIEVFLRLTLQKSVFELASSMGGEPQNLDEMFEQEFNLNEDEVMGELPPGLEAEFSSVNSPSEFGFELRYRASRALLESAPDGDAAFVPRISPTGMSIPLGEGQGGEGSDEFAAAFLGSSKYRLLISKRFVSRVSEARLVAADESYPVTVIDLPDVWLLEFPIGLWVGSTEASVLEVLF
jgi:hypothetical protein